MPVDLPRRLVDLITTGDAVLFIGAGATRDAGGPTGSELAQLLADHFGKKDIPTDDLRRFADILTNLPSVDREDVDKKIIDALKVSPSEGHRAIPAFCWWAIFTTNYDRAVELAYETAETVTGQAPLQDYYPLTSLTDGFVAHDRARVGIFKLHGCVSAIGRGNPLVLTTRDFKTTEKKRRKMLRVLKSLAKEHALLFAGYSFADRVILDLLDELEEESPYGSTRRMYAIDPAATESAVALLQSRNIEHIPATFSDFFKSLSSHLAIDARRSSLARRLSTFIDVKGQAISLSPQLRLSLENQLEWLTPQAYPTDGRRFLSGLPPENSDLKGGNDVRRREIDALTTLVRQQLTVTDYMRPLVVVLGAGGTGKSTLACRVAFNLAEAGEALAFRLKAEELWDREQLVDLARRAGCPTIFVVNDIATYFRYKAARELRSVLSQARCPAILLLSCQKAVWNGLSQSYPAQGAVTFSVPDCVSREEARALIQKLVQHGLLPQHSRQEIDRLANHVIEDCEGHLVVAMAELVKAGRFNDIILLEYEGLSERARKAYSHVALLHQHGLSIPDYLLNQLTVKDWNLFASEVIRLDADLIIVQDLNSAAGRILFRTRHPSIARVVVDAVVPKHEDRVRMYRAMVGGVAGTQEDRAFLLRLLTSKEVRAELREDKYVEELFEKALNLFPDDRGFLLHLGKFETAVGNLDRAQEVLEWARSLDPRDSYVIHQLGVCMQRRAEREEDSVVRDARFQEAVRLFRMKQDLDPLSHYGYTSEARLHLGRSEGATAREGSLEAFSAAANAIARGLAVVRPEDRGFLRECEAQVQGRLGDPRHVVAIIEKIRTAEPGLRYASSYHLLAACLFQLDDSQGALAAVEEGLSRYPGDARLATQLVGELESRIHEPAVRERFKALIASSAVRTDLGVVARFVEAVTLYYDGQFSSARTAFRGIRELTARRAPTRVRVIFSQPDGTPTLKSGTVRSSREGRLLREHDTGLQVPLDDTSAWERLGRPPTLSYQLGFGLAGPRALIVGPASA